MSTVPNPAWGDDSSDRLGYDGAGRTITKRYVDSTLDGTSYDDATAIVGFTTAYDLASNKRYERHLHAENRSHLYPTLDSMNRLREYQRGTLQEVSEVVSVQTAITLPGADTQRTYNLDGLGNWRRMAQTPVGGNETTEVRRHNHVNQITKFGSDAVTYGHGDNENDAAAQGNGNIVNDGTRRFVYDAFNRIKEVYKESGGVFNTQIAAYTYDALGRRIRMETTHGGLSGGLNEFMANYYYDGAQCIEEQDSSHDPYRQYVWGQYVDELIQQREINDPDIDHYMLSDLLYRAVALTNASAEIQEACDCDAYGNTIVYEAAGAGGDWFADDARSIYSESPAGSCCPTCEFIFTGRRFDPETSDAATQMYFYRARYYSPTLVCRQF